MFFHSRELVGERGTNIFVRNLNMWAGPYPFSGLLRSIFFVTHVLGGDDCFYFFHLQTKLYSQAVSGWFTLPWHFSSGAFHSSSEGLRFFASLLSSVWVLSQPVGCEWWILPVRSPEVLTAHAACAVSYKRHILMHFSIAYWAELSVQCLTALCEAWWRVSAGLGVATY